mgnify:CR=1 FL=1
MVAGAVNGHVVRGLRERPPPFPKGTVGVGLASLVVRNNSQTEPSVPLRECHRHLHGVLRRILHPAPVGSEKGQDGDGVSCLGRRGQAEGVGTGRGAESRRIPEADRTPLPPIASGVKYCTIHQFLQELFRSRCMRLPASTAPPRLQGSPL